MKIIHHIKILFLLLLTYLIGATPCQNETKLISPQNQVSFSIEKNQDFQRLEKEVQPNIGFLKEKSTFVAVEGVSAVNNYNFSEVNREYLAQAGDDWFSLSSFNNISAKIPGGVNKTNIGKTLWNDAYKITPPARRRLTQCIYVEQ